MNTDLYTDPRAEMMAKGDTGFCVPLALSVVSGRDVNHINDLLCQTRSVTRSGKFMRYFRKGVYASDWKFFCKHVLDLNLTKIDVASKTVVKLERELARRGGRYLIRVKGHCIAFAEGRIQDWTKGRRHRIVEVLEVTGDSIPAVTAPVPPAKPETPRRPVAPKGDLIDRLKAEFLLWDVKQSGRWVSLKVHGMPTTKITESRGRFVIAIPHSADCMQRTASKMLTELSVRKRETTFASDSLEGIVGILKGYC